MCDACPSITVNAARRYDPTQTTILRQRFEGEAARRFRSIKGKINKVLIQEDGFGLRANAGRFDFPRDTDKASAFMAWLQDQVNLDILEIRRGQSVQSAAEQAWSSIYVRSAYQRGMAQSAAKLRSEGVEVADQWVTEAFTRPFHADRAGLIYTRSYNELRGITSEMDRQISRVLAENIARGSGARVIAAAINDRVDKIGITRARMLGRTEVIRAHAEASLNSYQEAGILGVGVMAEFQTARDDQVCPECDALAGREFTIDEARGLIPVHPNCRCTWIPVVQNPREVRLS